MGTGIRMILCVMVTVLIMISEKGIPVKLKLADMIIYGIVLCMFISLSEVL